MKISGGFSPPVVSFKKKKKVQKQWGLVDPDANLAAMEGRVVLLNSNPHADTCIDIPGYSNSSVSSFVQWSFSSDDAHCKSQYSIC
jgi:hypothetical protein